MGLTKVKEVVLEGGGYDGGYDGGGDCYDGGE
jgi:hypothetical protein